MSGWRLPLRIARRDAIRHRGRSVLVLVMISLPVLAVTAADVLIQTSQVSGTESIDRRMGSAAALVSVQQGVDSVEQHPDPDEGLGSTTGDGADAMPTADQVSQLLGGARLLEIRNSEAQVATDKGRASVGVTEVDLSDDVTDGLFELTSGRAPRDRREVVVNQALLDKGYAVGDNLDVTHEDDEADALPDPRIVGVAESTTHRTFPIAVGPLGAFGVDTELNRSWLVDGDPVAWETVRELNAIGAIVASRAVITDPPPASEFPASVYTDGLDEAVVAVLVLVVVMALIEVVLLAGPAFAVGARKQQRSLALMAATGGTPAQSRRVVMSSAVVLGGAAASAGVLLGVGLAWLLLPVVQSFSGSWLGPFEVPWWHLLGVAGFGMLSAFLAAVVPARTASRQDVVAVLAGRRGDRAPSLRSPLLGVVLLGVGIAGSAYGALKGAGGELAIAFSAIPAVLGVILLIPLVLGGLGRVSGRLPVVIRYAIRDAARHRTRTVPAVAAVVATVAGVVALGIGVTSDGEETEQRYAPTVTKGTGVVTSYGEADWDAFAAVIDRELPAADQTLVRGVDEGGSEGDTAFFVELQRGDGSPTLNGWSISIGSSMLVSDHGLPPGIVGLPRGASAVAKQALAAGRIVAFTDQLVDEPEVDLTARVSEYDPATGEESIREVTVPGVLIPIASTMPGAQAVLPTSAAEELDVPVATVGLVVDGVEISAQQEEDVSEGLAAVAQEASLYVERGYQADDETVIVQWVLFGLGALLMLGGTLTATFLALSDARPDLATLAAVGASPRTRRGVASSYAMVVGLVGALLGAAVGFIPGVAVSYPLTSLDYGCVGACEEASGPFLDIPWLLVLGLVVVLPLLTAAIVGLFARSRLPLVARLD